MNKVSTIRKYKVKEVVKEITEEEKKEIILRIYNLLKNEVDSKQL